MVVIIRQALENHGHILKEFAEVLSSKTGRSVMYCYKFGFSCDISHIPEKHREKVTEVLGSFGITWDEIGVKEVF